MASESLVNKGRAKINKSVKCFTQTRPCLFFSVGHGWRSQPSFLWDLCKPHTSFLKLKPFKTFVTSKRNLHIYLQISRRTIWQGPSPQVSTQISLSVNKYRIYYLFLEVLSLHIRLKRQPRRDIYNSASLIIYAIQALITANIVSCPKPSDFI